MLKFSACRKPVEGKGYYKNFFEESEEMANMGHYLRKYALSSYLYGEGWTQTEPSEHCQGHKAWGSVVGAGNVLLFDFDSKYVPVTFEMLVDKLRGVSAYIAPSRSWSKEKEKYHVVVELDRELPLDKREFTQIYRAAAQWLGLERLYDPAMEGAVQNMSPHGLKNALEMHVEGDALCVEKVLLSYVPEEWVGDGSKVFAGVVPEDAVFTLSVERVVVGVEELLALVDVREKVRVHCMDGVEHGGGGGIDSAFVAKQTDGSYLYCCTGGSCSHTRQIRQNPFVAMSVDTVEEHVSETLYDIISANPAVSGVYTDEKAKEWQKEAAVNYGLGVLRDRENIYRVEGTLRKFNGKCWDEVFSDKAQIYSYVRDAVVDAGFVTLAYKNAFLGNAFNYYKNLIMPYELGYHGNYLNLRNCVLEVSGKGLQVHKHDRDYLFTSTLPYDYNPQAKAPVWETVVDRVMCGDRDTKEAFQQAMGYLLLREFNLEKMVCFVGEGENGKSTIFRVLKKLVGRSGYSAVPIKTLLGNGSQGEYARAMLAGKLVNITNELTPSSLQADAFKDLISGEDITARNIYESPFVLATVPKQIVAMNTTDSLIKERTHGFMRRLLLIPFNYTLREEHKDSRLNEKLEAELSGILNWVLIGAMEVVRTGKIKESLAMRRLFEEVKRDANPVQQFMEEHLEVFDEVDYDSVVMSGPEIYEHFRGFVTLNNYSDPGRNKFLAELRRLGVRNIDTTRRSDGRPSRKLKGYLCKLRQEAVSKVGFTSI